MRIIILFILTVFFANCSNDDSKPETECLEVLVNEEQYNLAGGNYNIQSVSIEETCLSITFSASGCSGDNWVETGVLKQLPMTDENGRNIYFAMSFVNDEECLAYITKTISFDLSQEILTSSHSTVNIHVKGYENSPIVINF